MSDKIQEILSRFESVSLKEIESVRLMNRTDTKFTFNVSVLNDLLDSLKNDYKVLQIDGKRQCAYKTLYYDTDNLSLYLEHHNGHLNRYKIRHRTYIESGVGFLEVKFKNNKGRTIKERIKKRVTPIEWEKETGDFLTEKTSFDPNTLKPTLWVNYKRITLVSKKCPERVTIDVKLEFDDNTNCQMVDDLVIAELKQDSKIPSVFYAKMKEMRIKEGSISKYCLGIAMVKPGVKINNFKEKLKAIKNLLYGN